MCCVTPCLDRGWGRRGEEGVGKTKGEEKEVMRGRGGEEGGGR